VTARVLGAVKRGLQPEEILRFLAEAGLLVGLLLIYWLIRGAMPERVGDSVARAKDIVHLEQTLGIFVEAKWNDWIMHSTTLVKIANWVYLWAHLPLIIFLGIVIYIVARERYRLYRNALLISAAIGLVLYGFFPVAPPRLTPDFGFADTLEIFAKQSYEMQPSFFVNQYAAVPSLHFGWALLLGIALFDITPNIFVRAFAVFFPTVMFAAIVLTANHFIFDGIVGGLVVIVAIAIAFRLHRERFGWWKQARPSADAGVDG